ncbi:MAG TPA: PilZ domain-containing protein [Candidatus Acidoferrum sp.]
MNVDRRLQERKQLERTVVCKLGDDESGSVLNLSQDGLCFESLTPIEDKALRQLRLSVELNGAIEATGQLAWIDSAKRTGGLRFLELSAPAREQIRVWLSETSQVTQKIATSGLGASSGRNLRPSLGSLDEQAVEGAVTEKLFGQEVSVASTELVSLERYRKQGLRQLLLGVLLGFGIGTAAMILIFRYAGGTKLGSPARPAAGANPTVQSSANRAGQSSANSAGQSSEKQTQVSAAQPVSSPPATPLPAKAESSLGANQAAVASAATALKADSSSGQAQRPKKVPATPEQLWSSFQSGNMKAGVALADLYMRGEGVEVNCEQARILLLVASGKKNAEASKKLEELDKGGCPPTPIEPQP